MARPRRRFGVLFYTTVALAAAILAAMPFFEVLDAHRRAWELTRGLRHPAMAAQDEAAAGPVRLGPVAPPWVIRAMADADPVVRGAACSIVLRTDPNHPAPQIDALAERLGDVDLLVRSTAAGQFHEARSLATRAGAAAADRAVGALRGALADPILEFRLRVVLPPGAFGPAARPAIPDLDRALREGEPAYRVHVAEALLRIVPAGEKPRIIVAALRNLLSNPEALPEADRAVRLLKEQLGEDGAAAVMIPFLQDGRAGVRQTAIGCLAGRCRAARATGPALVAALDGDNIMLRGMAAYIFLEGRDAAMAGRACVTLADQLIARRDGGDPPESIVGILQAHFLAAIPLEAARLIEAIDREDVPAQRDPLAGVDRPRRSKARRCGARAGRIVGRPGDRLPGDRGPGQGRPIVGRALPLGAPELEPARLGCAHPHRRAGDDRRPRPPGIRRRAVPPPGRRRGDRDLGRRDRGPRAGRSEAGRRPQAIDPRGEMRAGRREADRETSG